MVYFSLNWIVSVINSPDKYQRLILIGLALTRKANSGIQYILFHFLSYWRGWRPLVTPWACCIKEGIEPKISQKWFYPSHAQHQHPAPGLLATWSIILLATYKANQQTTPERGPQEVGSSTRPCNALSSTPAAKTRPLQRVIERCSPPAMPTKLMGKQWLQCRHSAAMGLASWEEEDELYCYLSLSCIGNVTVH